MERKYSIAEARSQLARIIDQAASGQHVELTRRGVPVAVVVSCEAAKQLDDQRAEFGALYKRFLEYTALEEVGVDKDFAESLRSNETGRDFSL